MQIMDFLSMGGYARYVWPCYLLTAAVLIANVVVARRRHDAELGAARRRAGRGVTGS
jgi:heme exporter protein CcmD